VFYRNAGTAAAISLEAVLALEERHSPSRVLGTDRPGRVVDAMDGSRSAVQETDWHAVAEERFLGNVASHLDEVLHAHRIKSLVVVAPPRAMGVLRDRLSSTAKRIKVGEIAKDLVKIPKPKLEEYLQSLANLG
jgi:protein required for attachment to host cells